MLRPAISFPRLRAQAAGTATSSAGASLSAAAASRLSARANSRSAATATGRLGATATATANARQGGVRRLLVGVAVAAGLAAALGALLRRRGGG